MTKIPETLYCVSFEDFSADGALAAEMLSALEVEFSTWIDRENNRVIHTVYSLDLAGADEAEEQIRSQMAFWKEIGIEADNIQRSVLSGIDWSEAWKKYFHPIEISERLLILPSWLENPNRPGQKVLTIDPGMSFGTGQHATTLFCLKVIDKLGAEKKNMSLLDAGCGSGILAIAGSLCGFAPIDAFDFDPDAVMITKENMALNKVVGFEPVTADAADYQGRPEKYDLVCANILAHLLKSFRTNIVSWVKTGGYLALAGILETEFQSVVDAYTALGFELIEAETLKEWRSGLFRKK
ncbi:MAG: 50S ribosomal protein L11 methyltransferase [Lentisphaeria bacterium]|nr:50S ribosomal protein L11 methyltransferase [Lentisphaeria bacterium]